MTKGFKFIGMSVRTTNQNNQAQKDLGQLWGKFYSEDILNQIPNKISPHIISIYTDYESDFKGAYTALLGVQVSSLEEIPQGLVGREFPADNFQKFIAQGEMPQAVLNTWTEIWNKASLNRKYSYDFEVYGDKSQNGPDSEVEIYLAIH